MFFSYIIGLFSFVLMILFVVFNQNCLSETRNALYMFLNSVFPAMFPFYVLTAFLTPNPLLSKMSKISAPATRFYDLSGESSSAMILGLLCGFPVGAKVTCDLYKNNLISKSEATVLASFTNSAGPAYVITIIGNLYLKSLKLGFLLWFCLLISSLLSGLLICKLTAHQKPNSITCTKSVTKKCTLPESIISGLNTSLYVGAVIVFFASVTSLLKKIPFLSKPVYTILYCTTELTGGLKSLSDLFVTECIFLSAPLKIALMAATIGWSGFCVHMQVCGILKSSDINTGCYILGKIFQSIFAFIISFVIFSFI